MPDVDSIFPDLVNHDLYLRPGDPAQVSVGAGQQAGRVSAHNKQDFVNTGCKIKSKEPGTPVLVEDGTAYCRYRYCFGSTFIQQTDFVVRIRNFFFYGAETDQDPKCTRYKSH